MGLDLSTILSELLVLDFRYFIVAIQNRQTGKFANCAPEIGFLPNFCASEIRFCASSFRIFSYNCVFVDKFCAVDKNN